MLPTRVTKRMSALARLPWIAANDPPREHIAAEMPNTIVFVRARCTPITADAVSLSRMAMSERPTRLFTIPRHTR